MARLERPGRPAITYAHRPGRGPTILFLPGYKSDMAGSKALALDVWAAAQGRAMLRLDYAGCGESEGAFIDQTLAGWLADALAVVDAATDGPLLVVGSSMGGWLMLLLALARPDRIAALVGVAAAPDFTEWGFDADARAVLARDGILMEPTPYGPDPVPTTHAFWTSGQALRVLPGPIPINAPVRLLHGMRDEDVPHGLTLELSRALRSADVQAILVKDGDHRLSRPQDIALLIATVDRLLADLP